MKNKLLIATMFLFLLVWITVGFMAALILAGIERARRLIRR